jgi:mannitol/fructose-specific phosphotransferase system IIA component (Ntr-type)
MTFYVVQGLLAVFNIGLITVHQTQMTPFFAFGAAGFFATVGTVFVSYAGLTKVASVSEEVRNPDRNIPLGMILSLIVTTTVYVLGVYIMVAVLPPADLRADLTPVATSGEVFLDWLPEPTGLILVVLAAVAAFASTGNAGILAASRYPLAMARDKRVPPKFKTIGSRGTPTFSIIVTAGLMIAVIVFLDVEQVAKLASAFQLLIFALLNVAVIVMRESRISTYLPGYVTPLYPWMQIFGAVTGLLLIAQIGVMSALFTAGLVALSIGWYYWYGRSRANREGAIYHLFARLGQKRFEGLDFELREIMKERTPNEKDRYEAIVARAPVLDIREHIGYDDVVERAAELFEERIPYSAEDIKARFLEGVHISGTAISHGAALPDLRLSDVEEPELVLVRLKHPIEVRIPEEMPEDFEPERPVCALLFLISPADRAGQHLRVLSELVSHVDEDMFLDAWQSAEDETELREVLLRHERYVSLELKRSASTEAFIGKTLKEIHPDLPKSSLIALVRRKGDAIIPHGDTELREGDRITIIGNPEDIRELYEKHS